MNFVGTTSIGVTDSTPFEKDSSTIDTKGGDKTSDLFESRKLLENEEDIDILDLRSRKPNAMSYEL